MEKWMFLMKLGSKLGCHQRAERSLFFRGYQFPICARCTGVLVGECIGLLTWYFFKLDMWINFSMCIPMAIDWSIQRIGIKESTQFSRIITGTLGGIGLIGIEINALYKVLSWFA